MGDLAGMDRWFWCPNCGNYSWYGMLNAQPAVCDRKRTNHGWVASSGGNGCGHLVQLSDELNDAVESAYALGGHDAVWLLLRSMAANPPPISHRLVAMVESL